MLSASFNHNPTQRDVMRDLQELVQAASDGNLARINELLECKEVAEYAAAFNNQALNNAARRGYYDIANRLLRIPAVAQSANSALTFAALNGHLTIVNRLLEIPTVTKHAAARNNEALRNAVKRGHLEVANRLVKIKTVREKLSASHPYFIVCFRKILDCINKEAPFYDRYYGRVRAREPHDYEIDLVDALREIAEVHKIPLGTLSEEQKQALEFARRVNNSLLSVLLMLDEAFTNLRFTQTSEYRTTQSDSITCSDDSLPPCPQDEEPTRNRFS